MSGTYTGDASDKEVIDVTGLGGGLNKISQSTLNFTIEEAKKLLDLKEFAGDRHLKNAHVDSLIRAMKRGTFRPEFVCIIVCRFNGEVYRMNGQHTAWARVHRPADYQCQVTFIEYNAETEEDMRTLYASIDRSSPRTRANVITAMLAGTEEFEGVKSGTLRIMPMGFALWHWKTAHERSQHDGDDVSYLVKTNHYDLAMKVCAFLDKFGAKDYRHIMRTPVVAAMFATFNRAPQVATEFWTTVANGLRVEKAADPRMRLRNELQRTAIAFGNGTQSDKKTVSQEFMYRQCLVAWNAYREDRTLQIIKVPATGSRPGVK